jgi:hypothetical protein
MKSNFYQVGGSLPLNAPSYIIRSADEEYYQALLNGEFCYVLNARQTGKTSLKIKTMARLKKNNITCVTIDLGLIGTQYLSPQQFYASFLGLWVKGLNLPISLGKWWRENYHLSPIEKFYYFIETVIFTTINQPIIIFIDEVDSLLSLDFSCEDFFRFINECYDKRNTDLRYKNLNFSILGTGNFLELVEKTEHKPFISGRSILLTNFTFQEAKPLLLGFKNIVGNPEETLKNILKWTGGQPFLTQKLCYLLVIDCQINQTLNKTIDKQWLNQFVHDKIIENWEIQDEPVHLKTIRDRILNAKHFKPTLKLYQQILQGKKVKFTINQEHIDLILSGLVNQKTEIFELNNKICTTIFNDQWLEEKL